MATPTYPELQKMAAERGINPVGKKKAQLVELLGIVSDGTVVIDESQFLSDLQKRDMEIRKIEIPRPITVPEAQEKIIRKFVERNPGSFSGYNFKDREQQIIITFSKDAECVCGSNWRMGDPDERTKQDPITFANMCVCGRKWIYIDPDMTTERF